jgi:hypothetical protein
MFLLCFDMFWGLPIIYCSKNGQGSMFHSFRLGADHHGRVLLNSNIRPLWIHPLGPVESNITCCCRPSRGELWSLAVAFSFIVSLLGGELICWWRWLSSGLLRRVVWCKFTDVSEVLAASFIKAMSKPSARNWFETWERVGQGRTLNGPMVKRVRIGLPCCHRHEVSLYDLTSIIK